MSKKTKRIVVYVDGGREENSTMIYHIPLTVAIRHPSLLLPLKEHSSIFFYSRIACREHVLLLCFLFKIHIEFPSQVTKINKNTFYPFFFLSLSPRRRYTIRLFYLNYKFTDVVRINCHHC